MQWSKLRSHLLEFVAPGVRKRVDFHLINYRKLSELANEFLVTIDGVRVFSASTSRHTIAQYVETRTTGLLAYGDGPDPKKVEDTLTQRETHAPVDITSSIRTYFDLDPHIALTSTDPILRALAMIDGRIGKRTLKSIELPEDEHSLVKILYALRMESSE
ncbi:MAG: hypothetical protein ACLQHF_12830 [Terracidiphilus sp.]